MSEDADLSCDWQVRSLRLTAFPSPAAEVGEPTWWLDVMGDPPEHSIRRPRKGELKEIGPFEGGQLALSVGPGRIDWVHSAQVGDDEDETFPIVGTFSESSERFLQLMLRWLGMSPRVERVAFGAELVASVEDRDRGYRQLEGYLPNVTLDPVGSSDFSYQINRTRESTSGMRDLRINRLSRWSVGSWQRGTISLGPSIGASVTGPKEFACHLVLDINTVPDLQGELPREHLEQVVRELVELGREIATRGDIP